MKTLIGFATQFYTLWDYEVIKNYTSDAYGHHYISSVTHKFHYVKNISTDIDKVRALYPNVEIDEELRGQSRDFFKTEKADLPKGFFWFGKYYGKTIDDIIVSDFDYCLWVAECGNNDIREQVKSHSVFMSYIEDEKRKETAILADADIVKEGDTVELYFISNGYNADSEYTECLAKAEYGDTKITVKTGVKPVDGMYPYLMPVINGVAKRTKGKTFKVKVLEVIDTQLIGNRVTQFITVK